MLYVMLRCEMSNGAVWTGMGSVWCAMTCLVESIHLYVHHIYIYMRVHEWKGCFSGLNLFKTVTSWRHVLTCSSVQLQVQCSLLILCAPPLWSMVFSQLISKTNSAYLFHIPSEYMYSKYIKNTKNPFIFQALQYICIKLCVVFVRSVFKENKAKTADAEPTKWLNSAPRLTSQHSIGQT